MTESGSTLKAAIVHDWFAVPGGSEDCALEFSRMLPEAAVYTSFFNAGLYGEVLDPRRVHPWPMQRFSGGTDSFRAFLPLYPVWFGALRLRGYDLVISSSSAFAKSVRTDARTLHAAYIHTPMRFAWDLDGYLSGSSMGRVPRIGARLMRDVLRGWDRRTAARPDILVANSTVVQRRIEALWGRPARIIFPPVRVEEFTVSPQDDGFFLTAARMLSYRRLDLVVEACSRLGRPLVLVGKGPEEKSLRRIAGSSVIFKPRISRSELIDLMSRCSGYIVPGTEDFGIAPVEAMAAGKPVIAYRAGGAVDTVVEGVTGLFFDEPSSESLADAIDRFDKVPFDRLAIRRHAEEFAPDVFRQRWRDLLAENGIKV